MRPEALEALRGVDLILHAGDVGNPEVLRALGAVARVVAVRGNNDRGAWARKLPERRTIPVEDLLVHLVHEIRRLDVDPAAEGIALVVSGHSHKPEIREERGVTFVNPGSAGPRRFKLPVSVARCEVRRKRLESRLIQLL